MVEKSAENRRAFRIRFRRCTLEATQDIYVNWIVNGGMLVLVLALDSGCCRADYAD